MFKFGQDIRFVRLRCFKTIKTITHTGQQRSVDLSLSPSEIKFKRMKFYGVIFSFLVSLSVSFALNFLAVGDWGGNASAFNIFLSVLINYFFRL
jgi:hypothetical protein